MEVNQRPSPPPIPPPHDEDDEDVHWALSTAGALWGRGEREEALRWLRRAAEQASDANADLRALELFKAAAEVATKLSGTEASPVSSHAAASLAASAASLATSAGSLATSAGSLDTPSVPTAGGPGTATTVTGSAHVPPPPRPGTAVPPPARSARPPRPTEPDIGRQSRVTASTPPAPPKPTAPSGHPIAGSAPPGNEAPTEPIRAVEMLGSRSAPPPGAGARDRRAVAAPQRVPPVVPVLNAPPLPHARDVGAPKSVSPPTSGRGFVGQSGSGRPPAMTQKPLSVLGPQPSSGRGSIASQPPSGHGPVSSRARPVQSGVSGQSVSEPRPVTVSPNSDGQDRVSRSRARTITRLNPTESDSAMLLATTREGPAVSPPTNEADPDEGPPSTRSERPTQDRIIVAVSQAGAPGPQLPERTPAVHVGPGDAASPRAPAGEPEGDGDGEWSDDDVTIHRDLTALRREQREREGIRTEDSDDTSDLGGQVVDLGSRQPSAPRIAAPEGKPRDGGRWAGQLQSDGPAGDNLGEETLPIEQVSAGLRKASDNVSSSEMHDTLGMPIGVAGNALEEWGDSAEPVDWRAPVPRLPTTAQIEPLPALRVAVIGTSRAGELRLVPLDGRSAPPMGAALAILVPLSVADGDALVQLLKRGG